MIRAMIQNGLSLRKSLTYADCSRDMYYYEDKSRDAKPDPVIVEKIRTVAVQRPTYDTRRMAAMLIRMLQKPVSRKTVEGV